MFDGKFKILKNGPINKLKYEKSPKSLFGFVSLTPNISFNFCFFYFFNKIGKV
jgi:hypothetical protein